MVDHTARIATLTLFEGVCEFFEHFFIKRGAKEPTLDKAALKAVEETGEFCGAVFKGKDRKTQEDEWADAMFALLHVGLIARYDIAGAFFRVVAKNREKYETAVVINGAIIKREDVA